MRKSILCVLLLFIYSQPIRAQGLDFGDAPENTLAYPSGSIPGNFPTCMEEGSALWIQHGLGWARLGQGWDPEDDGNAGLCPGMNYDQDECFVDSDAGLMFPPSYTITGTVGNEIVVPCSQQSGSLGSACQTAVWGHDIDIWIINSMQSEGYVNVLMDWDRNGSWGGASVCPGDPQVQAPEHILVDWPVPAGYNGPLSGLTPPSFVIGPNFGFCWARFSITEVPVLMEDWAGDGSFTDGETEDYLLHVTAGAEELDFGDAPDPSYATSLAHNGARHILAPGIYLGSGVDSEEDGQQSTAATGDDVGDGQDDEDGIVFTSSIIGGHSATVTAIVSVPGVIDAWIDFNIDGDWDDAGERICDSMPVFTGANVLSFSVPSSATVGSSYARFRFSTGGGLNFSGLAVDGEVEDYLVDILVPVELAAFSARAVLNSIELQWTTHSETENLGFHIMRSESEHSGYKQITTRLLKGAGNATSERHYRFVDDDVKMGETYYYMLADVSFSGNVQMHGPVQGMIERPTEYVLSQNYPNPFNSTTRIAFQLSEGGMVELTVYNINGQLVSTLVAQELEQGRHEVIWNGTDSQNRIQPSGVYLYVLKVNDYRQTRKLNFVK